MKIKITADTICDLSAEVIKKYNIGILPVHVILGDNDYADSSTITQDEFYKFLKESAVLPKTSAYNPSEVEEFFEQQLASDDGYDALIHFTISSQMSAIYNNSAVASKKFKNKVFVIDSKSLSTGIGLQILYACDLMKQGLDAKSIAIKVTERTDRVQASFVLDKLTYLHKGGRCSSIALFATSVLKIKPIIVLKSGEMKVGKKLMGRFDKCVDQYVDWILANYDDIDRTRCFITHTPINADIVKAVRTKIEGLFDEIIETDAGCTVGAHCGPNTIGILYYRK